MWRVKRLMGNDMWETGEFATYEEAIEIYALFKEMGDEVVEIYEV